MDGAGLRFLPVHSAGHYCTTRSCRHVGEKKQQQKNGQVNNILLHNVEDVAELQVIRKTVRLRYLCEPPYP